MISVRSRLVAGLLLLFTFSFARLEAYAQDHHHVFVKELPTDASRDPNLPGSIDNNYFRAIPPHREGNHTVWEYFITVTEHTVLLANKKPYKVWAYGNRVPGPTLTAVEGDLVKVTLSNETSVGHPIHFHGLYVTPEMDGVPPVSPMVMPGSSYTYSFIARPAGTHFYHCHVDTNEHMNRGMSGAFIVKTRIPEPRVDLDWVLLLSEWNSKYAEEGKPGNPREVNDTDYFTINGKSFPYTAPIDLVQGQVARLRLINVGSQTHSIHLHGQSFLVTHKDGAPMREPQEMDTVAISPGERIDLLIKADQPGEWPMHCHTAAHQTNAGVYPGGMMTHVRITAASKPYPTSLWGLSALRKQWRQSAIVHEDR